MTLFMHALRTGLLGLACLLAVPAMRTRGAEPASAPTVAPGDTGFDAVDRIAITNLIGAMVRALDEGDVELLASTLAPEFCADYRIPGSPASRVSGRDKFQSMMAGRFEESRKSGVRRRHISSPPVFLEQGPDSARAAVHLLSCVSTHGGDWHPFFSALAEFRAVKQGGIWTLSAMMEAPDTSLNVPVGHPIRGSDLPPK